MESSETFNAAELLIGEIDDLTRSLIKIDVTNVIDEDGDEAHRINVHTENLSPKDIQALLSIVYALFEQEEDEDDV